MVEIRCRNCNKRLLIYEEPGFMKYTSPVKKCKKCGCIYADPRCHEIAIEGMPANTLSVKGYVVLILLGAFFLYRGIHLSGMVELGVMRSIQWLLPTSLLLIGFTCVIGGIVEIILIQTGKTKSKYDRLKRESEERLHDRNYAFTLVKLGYHVPEEYL